MRYRMRHKAFSIGGDYWVTDDRGARVCKIDGKVPRLRKALVLEDAHGHEYRIEGGHEVLAAVSKEGFGAAEYGSRCRQVGLPQLAHRPWFPDSGAASS
ncbi:MAG TPA: hypothetical protein VE442_04585 [Jatrophihabitans sp.]|nr:hypothetical protein [Jatrophihabitans sp.]